MWGGLGERSPLSNKGGAWGHSYRHNAIMAHGARQCKCACAAYSCRSLLWYIQSQARNTHRGAPQCACLWRLSAAKRCKPPWRIFHDSLCICISQPPPLRGSKPNPQPPTFTPRPARPSCTRCWLPCASHRRGAWMSPRGERLAKKKLWMIGAVLTLFCKQNFAKISPAGNWG